MFFVGGTMETKFCSCKNRYIFFFSLPSLVRFLLRSVFVIHQILSLKQRKEFFWGLFYVSVSFGGIFNYFLEVLSSYPQKTAKGTLNFCLLSHTTTGHGLEKKNGTSSQS